MGGFLMDIIKCRNKKIKKDNEYECGRHLMKFVNGDIHIPCPVCGHYAIVSIVESELMVIHVNKKSEEKICQKQTI